MKSTAGSEFGIDASLSVIAKKLDMPQFFTHLIESYPHLVNNAQVSYLNGGRKISREPDLERAVAIIKRSSVVGTTELFDVCMVTAEHICKRIFVPSISATCPKICRTAVPATWVLGWNVHGRCAESICMSDCLS
jgi:hypothetical protein